MIGEAPYTIAPRVEKSVCSTPGVRRRAWITAGTKKAVVTPKAGTTSRMRAGSTSRSSTVRQPWYRPTIDHPVPAMWNIGITARFTAPGVSCQDSAMLIMPWKKLSLVSITPFGRPVVPDVYSWNATSSPAGSTPGSVGSCEPSAVS